MQALGYILVASFFFLLGRDSFRRKCEHEFLDVSPNGAKGSKYRCINCDHLEEE